MKKWGRGEGEEGGSCESTCCCCNQKLVATWESGDGLGWHEAMLSWIQET